MPNQSALTEERSRILALVAERNLSIVFQPIVDMEDGRVFAFEALTRPGPSSGFKSPAQLFHAAENCGLLWELEEVSRQASFEAAAGWHEGTHLFLNSSPTVFADRRFPDSIRECLLMSPGLTIDRLVLEITELSDESMSNALVERALELKARGFKVAVDDAGAGTSGLNRIVQIRPAWIKLDTEFVRNIQADPFRQNLVRFFVHFARLSNINLVAEGIETAEELATVVSVGVRFAQGYYLARPAARSTISTPDFANEVRAKWRSIEERARASASTVANIGSLAEPVAQAPMGATLEQARDLLRHSDSGTGLLIMNQRRAAGWVWRSTIDTAIENGNGRLLVGELMSPQIVRLPSDTPLAEAIEVACVVDDQAPADPILVADGQNIRGIVRLRDLIRASTRDGRSTQGGITVLPTRVHADRHIADTIKAWRGGQSGQIHADAAFVDIRRFADYNAAFGYSVGDRMIRSLADMIDAEVSSRVPECFVAHLSDDRFLVTAPSGELGPRLYGLIDRFEEFATAMGGESLPLTPAPGVVASTHIHLPKPSLRVLLLDGALQEIGTASDLYRIERQLRDRCRQEEKSEPALGSRVIIDERGRAGGNDAPAERADSAAA